MACHLDDFDPVQRRPDGLGCRVDLGRIADQDGLDQGFVAGQQGAAQRIWFFGADDHRAQIGQGFGQFQQLFKMPVPLHDEPGQVAAVVAELAMGGFHLGHAGQDQGLGPRRGSLRSPG